MEGRQGTMNKTQELSDRDKLILHTIFNPFEAYGAEDDQADLPLPEIVNTEPEEDSETLKMIKQLEVAGVDAAEAGDTARAILLFTQAIEMQPERASTYNNRAQAYRLANNNIGAETDLNKAVILSSGQGSAARQAYTQRALLRRLNGDDVGALEDFKAASLLGSKFAKSQLVSMNPYAALCSAMMTEMIGKTCRATNEG